MTLDTISVELGSYVAELTATQNVDIQQIKVCF